jgi:hypothetical protein
MPVSGIYDSRHAPPVITIRLPKQPVAGMLLLRPSQEPVDLRKCLRFCGIIIIIYNGCRYITRRVIMQM